ncbi:CRISPR-associated protein Cas4 [Salinivirga cyanobacteriivorans]|uniref:CRISPR-associated protein Cas4 n=1 Tax=Salinivirga cyanobacteriivorans TaxID=1307839 RepID=A0A0S2I408_9BACT|nr:Dna2/Cas4 domain-containing protein [Salinivirga cyanobacteriivorans]ALO17057.1 CRISPR-associated protein Cas4 [Salinivirga cyanobacteriivorans]
MQITGTHFNYYLICHRKLWLFAHHVQMEPTSDAFAEGRFIHETTYLQRNSNFWELEIVEIEKMKEHIEQIIHYTKKKSRIAL